MSGQLELLGRSCLEVDPWRAVPTLSCGFAVSDVAPTGATIGHLRRWLPMRQPPKKRIAADPSLGSHQGTMTCTEALVARGTATRGTLMSSVTNRTPWKVDNASK